MNAEDEQRLAIGPLNCLLPEKDMKLLCTPECPNFSRVKEQIIRFYTFRKEMGQPLTVQQVIDGLANHAYAFAGSGRRSSGKCKFDTEAPTEPIAEV